jgi:hypothetical protein
VTTLSFAWSIDFTVFSTPSLIVVIMSLISVVEADVLVDVGRLKSLLYFRFLDPAA